MAEDELLKAAAAYRKSRILNSVKRKHEYKLASASKSSPDYRGGNSAVAQVLADASKYANQPVNTGGSPKEQQGDHNPFLETLHHIGQTPVIKQIIDTISTPLYITANIADYNTATDQHNTDKVRASAESGDAMSTALDFMGSQRGPLATAAGVMKGLSGGLGANRGDDNTMANSVKNLQERAGIDTESPESKSVQAWGGFGADVLLDPINAIPLAPAVKYGAGAIRGSKAFNEAKVAHRAGEAFPEHIKATRMQNAKAEGAKELAKYRKDQFDRAQARLAKSNINKQAKRMRGGEDSVKAKYLIENIHTLRSGVARALRNSMDDTSVEGIVDAAMKADLPVEKIQEAVIKLGDTPDMEAARTASDDLTTDTITDAIDDAIAETPDPARIGLSQFKKPTTSERLFDLISSFNVVDKKPIYGDDVIKNVNDIIKQRTKVIRKEVPAATPVAKTADELKAEEILNLRAGMKGATKPKAADNGIDEVSDIPDITKTIASLKAIDKKMDGTFKIAMKSEKTAKNVYMSVDDFADVIRHAPSTPEGMRVWQRHMDVLKDMGQIVYKTTKPKARPATPTKDINGAPVKEYVEEVIPAKLSDNDLKVLGVKPEHWDAIRKGTPIEELTDDIVGSGGIDKVIKDIKGGTITPAMLRPFYDYVGSKSPKKIADFIEATSKTPAFLEAGAQMSKYGTKLFGTDPASGIGGHGALASPSHTTTADDILAAKTPTNPDEAQQFLEALYTQSANALASHKMGADLRVLADDIFARSIDNQRRPAGPKRANTPEGTASVAEDLKSARYETLHNTHSSLYRINAITNALRPIFNKKVNGKYINGGRNKYDEAFMLVLRDVDNRLRLAGFDPHLSNMRMSADKLVVRLAPSDVLGVMTMSDRIRYIHGSISFSSALNEFLPSTILDLAEVLVRSATRLNPDGTLNDAAMKADAIATLQGKFVGNGTRAIRNTLDINTWNKNQEEILREIDKINKGKTNFHAQFMAKDANGKRPSPDARNAIIEAAKALDANVYAATANKRLDKTTQELVNLFTKKVETGKSKVNELINLNMRNASVMGGSVAREIGEASAEFTERVLNALDNGTSGEFISELVSKPPFKPTDPASAAVIKEARETVRNANAKPDELRHIDAADKNVKLAAQAGKRTDPEMAKAVREAKAEAAKGAKGGVKTRTSVAATKAAKVRQKEATKNNKEAYQKDPDLEAELAKPAKEQNQDIIFDLVQRERNKDLLYRAFGLSRFFNKRTGMPLSFDAIMNASHATPLIMTGFHALLKDLRIKGYNKEQLRTAFKDLQNGSPRQANDPVLASELNAVLSTMFDPSMNNVFTANTIGPKHFNEVLEKKNFDTSKIRVPESFTPQEMMNVWKHWDVEDVEDFFSKMMGAIVQTADEISMGASFSKHFGIDKPPIGREKDWVKIVDTSGPKDKNSFYELIDSDLYYPKPIAYEFVHINRLMNESRSFNPNSKFGIFMSKVFDPVISSLKMTQTTMKPGHHVMSIIGDTWRNNLALASIGMYNPARQVALYGESYRILRSSVGEIEELSGFEKFQRTQKITKEINVGQNNLKMNPKTGRLEEKRYEFYPNIAGGGRVTHQDMYAGMQTYGVALPAHLGGQTEDFLTNFDTLSSATGGRVVNAIAKTSEGLDRIMNPRKAKLPFTKRPYSINRFTANRDTFTRGALFLGAMRSKKFNSLEEAFEYSAAFVKKWSPTALDLGGFEAKYARRLVFYYTWLRGMVPRVIESTLMNPGVALIPNKAMYNMGMANGIDLQSIGDPFPDDQLMPSWYSQRVLGPSYTWGDELWGFNPTGPLSDVLNSLGSNVAPKDFLGLEAGQKVMGTFANMSTPWIKAPMEALVMRKQMQSGAPVEDPLEYGQDMIGPLRTASRTLGKDFYPTRDDNGNMVFPNRTEAKFRDGMTGEETQQNAMPELLNWLSGMQFTQYNSDSATKSAEFQEKQKLIDERKRQERLGQ